ncbi:hypothetical protein V6N13_103611 [Hibiscus sabdariffa]|uniref:Uncharacterized protein n=2 Tax=Hibiscus sabdariffa TaxID=183260 RepID=A0ABR2B5V8_9ROSI
MCRMASSITARGIAATVGVGPKLGRSIAHKFAHEIHTIAILARDLGRLSRFADEIAREEKAYQYNFLSNQAEINIHSPYQLFYLTRSNQWKVLSAMVKRRRGTILFTG